MAYKDLSYSERMRTSLLKEENDKEALRLKQIELDNFEEKIIKESKEAEKIEKGGNVKNKILNIFRIKK